MFCWQGAVPPPESSDQEDVLPQNRLLAASSARCQVGPVPDFVFCFLCFFDLLFDENEFVYSTVALSVIFPLHSKRVYASCIGIYILFFA